MLEIHGWITIRETYEVVDNEEEHIDFIIQKIKRYIQELRYNELVIKALNGEYFMEFSLFANRKASEVAEIFALIKFIGKIAKGSYGLVYMLDDEDVNGYHNEFQVFVLARGEMKQQRDMFLSPFIPVVEDEDCG